MLCPTIKRLLREILSGPMVRIWRFHCQSLSLIPSQGTEIPRAVQCRKKKKKKKPLNLTEQHAPAPDLQDYYNIQISPPVWLCRFSSNKCGLVPVCPHGRLLPHNSPGNKDSIFPHPEGTVHGAAERPAWGHRYPVRNWSELACRRL